ncbi:Zinc-binding oxidoreductase [Apiospora sp. TS-2023a]
MGLGITTVGRMIYMTLGLPLPGDEKHPENPANVLIYGGSTVTGTLAIQFAKASRLILVITASPPNFGLVKSRGADCVFDYHNPQCARRTKEFTKDSLHHVLDCISTEVSYNTIAEAMPATSDMPMQVVALRPTDAWPRPDIKATTILAHTTFGEAFTKFGMDIPAMPSHYEFDIMFWKLAAKLIATGRAVPHSVALRDGGLDGIPHG